MLPPLPPIEPRPASAAWMVTLADLVALMLTFFVLLFAISAPHPARLKAMLEGMVGRLPIEREQPAGGQVDGNVGLAVTAEGRSPDYLVSVLRRRLADDPLFADAAVGSGSDGITITVPLAGGTMPGADALRRLAPMLEQLRNRVTLVVLTGPGRDGWRRSVEDAGRLAAALGDTGFAGTLPLLGAPLLDGVPRLEITIADRDGRRG